MVKDGHLVDAYWHAPVPAMQHINKLIKVSNQPSLINVLDNILSQGSLLKLKVYTLVILHTMFWKTNCDK